MPLQNLRSLALRVLLKKTNMAALVDGAEVRNLGAERGNGVVATRALPKGTRLFEEFRSLQCSTV